MADFVVIEVKDGNVGIMQFEDEKAAFSYVNKLAVTNERAAEDQDGWILIEEPDNTKRFVAIAEIIPMEFSPPISRKIEEA